MGAIPKETVRYIFGTTILITHFATIFIFFYLGMSRLNGIAEVAGAILTVTPLTSLYFTAFLRHVVLNDDPIAQVGIVRSGPFAIQFIVVLLFCGSLLIGTTYLFLTAFIDFGNIGVYTGLIETLFAAYMAIIFNNLFPDTMPKTAPVPPVGP